MKKPRLQHNHIFLLNNDTNDKNAGDDDNDNVKYLDAVNKNDDNDTTSDKSNGDNYDYHNDNKN